MNLAPSDLQAEIAAGARQFLAGRLPVSRIRLLAEGDGPIPDEATWRDYAEQGWLGVAAPEEVGGLGLSVLEEIMLFRELGRGLAPGPLLGTVLGARLALARGDAALAGDAVAGAVRVGVRTGESAVDAAAGDLAVALGGAGARLERITSAEPADATDPLSRVVRVTRAQTVFGEGGGSDLTAHAHLLAGAMLVGVTEAVRDLSVDYARTRTQFGRPIGTFQAVKHRCADMEVAAYAATSQLRHAALAVHADRPDAAFQAAAAYVVAARGAVRSATDTIQNLGGIGFTWEHDAHLYLTRAVALGALIGPLRDAHARLLAPERQEFR